MSSQYMGIYKIIIEILRLTRFFTEFSKESHDNLFIPILLKLCCHTFPFPIPYLSIYYGLYSLITNFVNVSYCFFYKRQIHENGKYLYLVEMDEPLLPVVEKNLIER